jgi:hypothetical protein
MFDVGTGSTVGAAGNTVDGKSFIDAAYMRMFGRKADVGGATVYLNKMQESGAVTVNSDGTMDVNTFSFGDTIKSIFAGVMSYASTWGTESHISNVGIDAIVGGALSSASQYNDTATYNGATAAQLVSTSSMDEMKNEVLAEAADWRANVQASKVVPDQ